MADIAVSNTFVQAAGQEGTPVAVAAAIKGGWLGVADTTARDALLSTMLEVGQVVLVISPAPTLYRWDGSSWLADIAGGASIEEVATYGDLPGSPDAGDLVVVLDPTGDGTAVQGEPTLYVRNSGDTAWIRLTPGGLIYADAVQDAKGDLDTDAASNSKWARVDQVQSSRVVTGLREVFWMADTTVTELLLVPTVQMEVTGIIVRVSGAVFTSASGSITLDVKRTDTDATLLSSTVDVEALSLGRTEPTLSVASGRLDIDTTALDADVEIVAELTSDDANMTGGALHVQVEAKVSP